MTNISPTSESVIGCLSQPSGLIATNSQRLVESPEKDYVPFNRPYMTGNEGSHIARAHSLGHLSGDGQFTKKCHDWLERETGAGKALLTQSCTAALEMAAILADLKPGDEVIMPSYTFVSTANAFVLRGAIPVFVDCRQDTLNIDENAIERAITPRTRVIVPVHYAGVACEMDTIMAIAARYNLLVIEDAAQGIMASYQGRPVGTIGDMGTFSFHETKNIISGEGGCLLLNRPDLNHRAEVIREKGTNRSQFFRGEVDKYSWVDIGSSFLPSEITAAFLWAQLEKAQEITEKRLQAWEEYNLLLAPFERDGLLRRPVIPQECAHNAHMYYILLQTNGERDRVRKALLNSRIASVTHYVPLHSSPAGLRYGRFHGELVNTDEYSSRLLRLPMWIGVNRFVPHIVGELKRALRQNGCD
jgi:dTDP-4-amino-4,6-dideoxygalactose transaminase